jgi:muramoyltetrapeptide carboxypeptidase
MIRPKDRIALVAPASALKAKEDVDRACENMRELGLELVLMPNVGKQWGYLAGTDEERASDVNEAFSRPNIRAIWCIRGGYGTGRILPLLDYPTIRRHPKAVLGFSDITGLLLGLWRKVGLVGFHGPDALMAKNEFARDVLARAVMSHDPIGRIAIPKSGPRPTALKSGIAEGPLVGGNLSLVSSLGGTPFSMRTKGAIVFLEDVGEAPYRIDRMLNQLHLTGSLRDCAAVAFGSFSGCDAEDTDSPFKVADVLQNVSRQTLAPVVRDLPFGHQAEQVVLPIGVRARLDATGGTLTILESAVSET